MTKDIFENLHNNIADIMRSKAFAIAGIKEQIDNACIPLTYTYAPYVPITINDNNKILAKLENVNTDDPNDADMVKILQCITKEVTSFSFHLDENSDFAISAIISPLLKKENGHLLANSIDMMVGMFSTRLMMSLMHVLNRADSGIVKLFATTREYYYSKMIVRHIMFTGLNEDVQAIINTCAI